jgi:hypothetical protein
MPTYVAFGKDFGVTVDAEPEEVAKEFSAVPPGQLVEFQGTQQAIGIRLLPQRRECLLHRLDQLGLRLQLQLTRSAATARRKTPH